MPKFSKINLHKNIQIYRFDFLVTRWKVKANFGQNCEGFPTLCSCCSKCSLQSSKFSSNLTFILFQELQARLRTVKQYITSDYRWHVSRANHVADHCITLALSDPKLKQFAEVCGHDHKEGCELCFETERVMEDMEQITADGQYPSCEVKSEVVHDFQRSRTKVMEWKCHVLRTVNQETAKKDILSNMGSEEVLIVMDWAMKFIPWFDREKQSDYYGKKGINWNVSIAIFGSSSPVTQCYVHLLNSVPQGWFAVASILEHLLHTIKEQRPSVKVAYLRSDNAACYHCGPLLSVLHGISDRTGIAIRRYDFSEAQSGKDICDRRTAPLKIHAKRYGHEGHNISTAEELKEALESHGGVANTKVYVVDVDFSMQQLRKCAIPNVNNMNNFLLTEDGIRMWQAYQVGEGHFISKPEMQKLSNSEQGQTGLIVSYFWSCLTIWI